MPFGQLADDNGFERGILSRHNTISYGKKKSFFNFYFIFAILFFIEVYFYCTSTEIR